MAKRKQNKQRKQIKRTTRHFQLRVDNPKDAHVREVLDYAKSQRREVTVIREAVTLYWALENGNLEALFEAFPQYKAHLTPSTPAAGGGGPLDEIKGMLELIAAQQKTDNGLLMRSAGQGPKQIAAPTFAMPIFEDDDQPTVIISKSTSMDSSMNFVNALKGMQ